MKDDRKTIEDLEYKNQVLQEQSDRLMERVGELVEQRNHWGTGVALLGGVAVIGLAVWSVL